MRVAVLGGGRSSEHDVSLRSAVAVRSGLAAAGHEAVAIEVGRDGVWRRDGDELTLKPGRGLDGVDVVFLALHGPFGEDGSVQGLLECLDVPYVGAGVAASAVCMDKLVFKELMAQGGIPQVAHAGVAETRFRADSEVVLRELERLGLPVFVKPARLGSSVGIVKVSEAAALRDAVAGALEHDPRVVVEASATGLEVECSVVGNGDPVASEPGEIVITGDGWYDYAAKYEPGGMELVVPARIGDPSRERVRELALDAFVRSGCCGMARVDFFVDGELVLVNELNTIPGFTETSVFAKLFEASGVPYPELLDRLVSLAVERHEDERRHRF